MSGLSLEFNGIGRGHDAWLQCHRSQSTLFAMAKDPIERNKLACWQVLATVMAELSRWHELEASDAEYWDLVARQLGTIRKIVKANPSYFMVPRKDRAERRNSWLPADLLTESVSFAPQSGRATA